MPNYEVGLQSQLEPMTLTLWSSGSRTFRFRGRFQDVNTITGWLVREEQPAVGPLAVDSAALTLNRDR